MAANEINFSLASCHGNEIFAYPVTEFQLLFRRREKLCHSSVIYFVGYLLFTVHRRLAGTSQRSLIFACTQQWLWTVDLSENLIGKKMS